MSVPTNMQKLQSQKATTSQKHALASVGATSNVHATRNSLHAIYLPSGMVSVGPSRAHHPGIEKNKTFAAKSWKTWSRTKSVPQPTDISESDINHFSRNLPRVPAAALLHLAWHPVPNFPFALVELQMAALSTPLLCAQSSLRAYRSFSTSTKSSQLVQISSLANGVCIAANLNNLSKSSELIRKIGLQNSRNVSVKPVAASNSAIEGATSKSDSSILGGEQKTMKVVGVFYKAFEYAKDPKFLGCAENALGLREFLESKGHTYIVTDDKEGDNCELEKHIPDMDILITTPFHPAYMTAERLKKAKNLKLILTAGVGSDHIDLHTAAEKGMTVVEVSGSNVVSVAEDELMRILILLRNFVPAHKQVSEGGWNVAAVAYKAFDLQGKTVGTVGSGRIGQELLKRLKAFDCKLLYYARHSMGEEKEKATGATWESDLDKFLAACDVVSINLPLSDKTRGMFNKEVLNKMKPGAMLVNNARGAIVDVDAVKEACESGQLGGYSGDVWNPQPPPKDHCWRYMPNQAMTPHISGTTIDAQARYAHGVQEMLEQYFCGKALPEENYIVREGELAGQYQ